MSVGVVVSGGFDEVVIRQRSGERIEIGELLKAGDILLQVFDLDYGSLMSGTDIERIGGMQVEGYGATSIYEEKLRNYVLARAKPIYDLRKGGLPKYVPRFLGEVERVTEEDLKFISEARFRKPLYLGKVRSGSRVLDIPVYVDGERALTHHILIPATTGRGKSNLMKVLLWNLMDQDYAGILVLDPHNEYYSYTRDGKTYGLSQHPRADEKLLYLTTRPPAKKNAASLTINVRNIRPWHLSEILDFSDAQEQTMALLYRNYRDGWIERLLTMDPEATSYDQRTIVALQRKISYALDLEVKDGKVIERGKVFSLSRGLSTIDDVVRALEDARIVVMDTSSIPERVEILIAGMIAERVFRRYSSYKEMGEIDDKPVISFVLEEAPRVLAGERATVFGRIAREGRKFKLGIIAITQLASLIPRELLANMNTKIILGNEMKAEREAIIGSASQDLSRHSTMIASLNKGEAIVSSIFTGFAVPIMIDEFEKLVDGARGKGERKGTLVPLW